MLLKLLSTTHPEYDAELWRDYWALYEGGKAWRERAHRFLPPNPQEPRDVYQQRVQSAHYRSYLGPIVDYFVSFLFTSKLLARAQRDGVEVAPDDYYAALKEDCDGRGTDLIDQLRSTLTRAMVDGCSGWLVELPVDGGVPPVDRADWASRGLGAARLRSLHREALLDWDADEVGELNWAITYERSRPRTSPRQGRDRTLHVWRVYDRETVETFVWEQADGDVLNPEQEIGSLGTRPHGFDRVPIVMFQLPPGLWLANRVESPQREHCSLSNAHTWLIRRTCYAMPIFKLKDKSDPVPATMGTGYYLRIGADEGFEWSSPPSTPFDAIRAEVASQKDEIHRIVHQMSHGVDNNAAAVGRSGESKMADAEATRVMLEAFGAVVREAVEGTYALITRARGEDYEWSIEGFDRYDVTDVEALLKAIAQAILLDIPSPTFGKEVRARAALALLPDIEESLKTKIREEIETGMVAEEQEEPDMPEPPELPETEDDAGDGEEEAAQA